MKSYFIGEDLWDIVEAGEPTLRTTTIDGDDDSTTFLGLGSGSVGKFGNDTETSIVGVSRGRWTDGAQWESLRTVNLSGEWSNGGGGPSTRSGGSEFGKE